MSEGLLSVKEVADKLGVSEFTVKRYAKENLIASVKEGAEFKFKPADVDRYIEITQKLNG
ncbi:helix-turn-helix domain-containing protein [Litoribrevibacter albus]|uniref:DNA-binding protein n=1 Tax=Litoribrevibacter albus TaxID=1473156 RepID=A0AA37SA03_9GAMM|nr:helix-turn-helix domain-containing protein [Litoribrevibacter albus]GLQ31134.1 DNA-binding protein [Litoribrevibacter albus]